MTDHQIKPGSVWVNKENGFYVVINHHSLGTVNFRHQTDGSVNYIASSVFREWYTECPANKAKTMTTMQDTNGKEHQIHAVGNVATLESIGWTVKAPDTANAIVKLSAMSEREWDTIFGMRR